jgi:hypothetical protein
MIDFFGGFQNFFFISTWPSRRFKFGPIVSLLCYEAKTRGLVKTFRLETYRYFTLVFKDFCSLYEEKYCISAC